MKTLNLIHRDDLSYLHQVIRNVKYSNKHMNITKGENLATSGTGACEINL